MRMTGLDRAPVQVGARAIEALAARLGGPTLRRGDPGFAAATRIWNAMVAKEPALVVQPVSTRDVREAVLFARANGILISVKGGGHNIAGTSLADGGLTLDMSRLRGVEVDPARRVARVDPGCLLGDVDQATQEYGLATVLGFISETGVAGLTLGGGFGYLTRRFGWTVDNLLEVEIVTADGDVRRAAVDEHEDLFWALRGGGGNFGVVTRFTYRLHEVGPQITGGLVAWDADDAGDVLALYRELAEAAPPELTLGAMIRLAPPLPIMPERWHGRPIVFVFVCHSGDPARAAADLAPLRALGRPIADVIRPKRYVEQQSMFNATQPKGLHNYWKSEFLPNASEEALEIFRREGAAIAAPRSQIVVFQLGGALAELDPAVTAFANRDAGVFFISAACWSPSAGEDGRDLEWVRDAWEAMRPHSTGGNYVNVQTADDDEERLRGAYRESYERLAQVKASYDPDNLFRVNRNVAPAARAATPPLAV